MDVLSENEKNFRRIQIYLVDQTSVRTADLSVGLTAELSCEETLCQRDQ
jgi:hypothetical protein